MAQRLFSKVAKWKPIGELRLFNFRRFKLSFYQLDSESGQMAQMFENFNVDFWDGAGGRLSLSTASDGLRKVQGRGRAAHPEGSPGAGGREWKRRCVRRPVSDSGRWG